MVFAESFEPAIKRVGSRFSISFNRCIIMRQAKLLRVFGNVGDEIDEEPDNKTPVFERGIIGISAGKGRFGC